MKLKFCLGKKCTNTFRINHKTKRNQKKEYTYMYTELFRDYGTVLKCKSLYT